MNKNVTPKGFRDFLPEKMMVRNEVIERLKSVFESYGFDELKTPALERQEVLLGKYGSDAEKLMYTFEDKGGRGVGLRYDLTIPLARLMTNNSNIPLPFKRYQIQPVWRAEKPQKGRYREFYQCDIDIVGSSSPLSDAEILAVINDSLKVLGFTRFRIKINSRRVLFNIMKKNSIPENKWMSIIQSIDKLDKKDKSEVVTELKEKGLKSEIINNIFESFKTVKPDEYLEEVIKTAINLGVECLEFTPTLSRGLDYYTGPIFETVVDEPKIGSITGGGRYDSLLKDLGGPDLPATGTTIGLDRVCDVIEELDLLKKLPKTNTKVLVTIFSKDLAQEVFSIAKSLRSNKINTEIYPSFDKKLDKQLRYADKKKIEYAVIIGPEEVKNKEFTLKELKYKKQYKLTKEELIEKLKD